MAGFEITEHTADVGVSATGADFEEALASLATGMFSVMAHPETVRSVRSWQVEVDSADREALVIDWLNELLYRYEAEGLVPKVYRVSVGESGESLVADCTGELLDPQRHRPGTVVKAATYHGLEISHNDEWRIRVVLDV